MNVNIEIDMEGTPLVEYTINTALECANMGYHVSLALQAYLNRTMDDIKKVIEHDMTVRLVKGAYLGDTDDFVKIQNRFKRLTKLLIENGKHFAIGTHDPELIGWLMNNADNSKDIIEIGFLKGLGNETKLGLVRDGWAVCEYVPFGTDSRAYITRRVRYLKELERQERKPVP